MTKERESKFNKLGGEGRKTACRKLFTKLLPLLKYRFVAKRASERITQFT